MELLSVIRRWHYRDHFSIREISRRTGLSRNTVRKYLRSDTVEPKFNIPDRPSKLDPYADKLSQMLRQEAGKSRKQKRTTKQLHADLAALGYDGSYNRVAAFARDWRAARHVQVYPERVVVAAEGQVVCEHRRVFARSHQRKSTTTVFDWRHYLAVIQRKPGALRNGAPFAELPPAFRALQQRMLKTPGGDREMVEILALVLQHDEQAVLTAVELALEAGVPTKTHILNLLHRLIDGKPVDPPIVKPPNALTLTSEPQANVERYDALRQAREARHAS